MFPLLGIASGGARIGKNMLRIGTDVAEVLRNADNLGDVVKIGKNVAEEIAEATVKGTREIVTSSGNVRVGRWMSQAEYDKMVKTGRVQMSGDSKVHVANPANIDAF